MMFLYVPVEESLYHDDIGHYHSFGICAFRDYDMVIFLSDVSTDRSFVKDLSALYTQEQLDPIHLIDAVENAL